MDGRMSLGINVSILIILIIFAVILVLPFRLLLDTNYDDTHVNTLPDANNIDRIDVINEEEMKKIAENKVDFAKLKLCPYKYEIIVQTFFFDYYDKNCTFQGNNKGGTKVAGNFEKNDETEEASKGGTNLSSPSFRIIRPKSVPVTDYILIMMLVFSVIGAFVEYLRIRFINTQDPTSSVESTLIPRRQSIVDLMLPRKCISREQLLKTQMSLDVPMGCQRSAVRVAGTSTPPLIRRSSFPAFVTKEHGLISDSTPPRSPRRPSTSVNDTEGFTSHHRSRLIRRH